MVKGTIVIPSVKRIAVAWRLSEPDEVRVIVSFAVAW